jgi:hypothetical protein
MNSGIRSIRSRMRHMLCSLHGRGRLISWFETNARRPERECLGLGVVSACFRRGRRFGSNAEGFQADNSWKTSIIWFCYLYIFLQPA